MVAVTNGYFKLIWFLWGLNWIIHVKCLAKPQNMVSTDISTLLLMSHLYHFMKLSLLWKRAVGRKASSIYQIHWGCRSSIWQFLFYLLKAFGKMGSRMMFFGWKAREDSHFSRKKSRLGTVAFQHRGLYNCPCHQWDDLPVFLQGFHFAKHFVWQALVLTIPWSQSVHRNR